MKYFVALCALAFTASAMPTGIGKEAAALNGTRFIPPGQVGFATMNGGTYGGAGGAVWTVWDSWALRDAVAGNTPRIVYVRGRIDLLQLFTGSPGVRIPVGSFKSIIGGDGNAMIYGGGLTVSNVQQVIIENLKFHNALSYAPGELPNGNGGIISQIPGAWSTIDNLGIEREARQVWVNHCEFADDPWNSAATSADRRRHDGLIDITTGANWISVSNSIFRNHNLVTLIGNNDNNAAQDVGRLKVTYYLNWFMGTTQRNPLVRFGEVHILNNLYTDIIDYGIGVAAGAQIYAERNAFINSRRAWGWASGIPNTIGFLFNFNNLVQNSGIDSGITGGGVNWVPSQYYFYTPMANTLVEAHVRRHAGTW